MTVTGTLINIPLAAVSTVGMMSLLPSQVSPEVVLLPGWVGGALALLALLLLLIGLVWLRR